ncbi:glycosyltransferase family 2 protein [Paenibacillus koleovorans]|uniref:glycosyltransferase family 2 protein n=1 Tax=Paenibacillus koleovorans TaxID=121608 RepID=UPI0013E39CF2|nr:glycosyltransferase family 2 protein [Paenibacillus koleovorans]
MRPVVSIIMIAYNKYPYNLLSLYALENQTYDLGKMEVILVDDASKDRTPELSEYKPPYSFSYIRCEHNVGRSEAKNIGVRASRGSLLVIIDSEMILDPEYVEQHVKLHENKEKLVVTGCLSHYGTFTVMEPPYNKHQMKRIQRLKEKNKFGAIPVDAIMDSKQKKQLFSKEDIRLLKYKQLSFHSPFFKDLIQRFGSGYKGFHMPYIFVITHCISIKRSTLDQAGPFYTGFKGWGCEDWEFGYRVYKQGAEIVDHPDVKVYHQEHPRSLSSQRKDQLVNYQIFYRLHQQFDVGVQSLCWIGTSLLEANALIVEYKKWMRSKSGRQGYIESCFLQLFDLILTLLIGNKPITGLLDQSGLSDDPDWMKGFQSELEAMEQSGYYPELTAILKKLIRF